MNLCANSDVTKQHCSHQTAVLLTCQTQYFIGNKALRTLDLFEGSLIFVRSISKHRQSVYPYIHIICKAETYRWVGCGCPRHESIRGDKMGSKMDSLSKKKKGYFLLSSF